MKFEKKYLFNKVYEKNLIYNLYKNKFKFLDEYTVDSIYFDTPDFKLARQNLLGLNNRYKIRFRSYSGNSLYTKEKLNNKLFLEKKIKNFNRVFKERFEIKNIQLFNHESLIKKHLKLQNIFIKTIRTKYFRKRFINIFKNIEITLDNDLLIYCPLKNLEYRDRSIIVLEKKFKDLKDNQDLFYKSNQKFSKYLYGLKRSGFIKEYFY